MVIEFDLPWPVSANDTWTVAQGRIILTARAREWRQKNAVRVRALGVQMITSPVRLTVVLYPPDRGKHDIDNTLKQTFDVLKHGELIEDDSLICELSLKRDAVTAGGAMSLKVSW